MNKLALLTLAVCLLGCEQQGREPSQGDPWSAEAEATFQQAEVLKFELEKLKLEQKQLQELEALEASTEKARRDQ